MVELVFSPSSHEVDLLLTSTVHWLRYMEIPKDIKNN